MTKQEEIRGGVEHVITVNHPYIASRITNEVMEYLHSQGVVIKVDRELPEYDCCPEFAKCQELCHKLEQLNMLKAGYVIAVEPLTEETK